MNNRYNAVEKNRYMIIKSHSKDALEILAKVYKDYKLSEDHGVRKETLDDREYEWFLVLNTPKVLRDKMIEILGLIPDKTRKGRRHWILEV